MADGILQYIGARYVPQFFLNSDGTPEWKPGVAFEPLTIVTWNNNSYTSRKPVPAEIGEPSLNPEYWAQTGVYNAQIGQLQNDVGELQTSMETVNKQVFWITPEMYGAVGDGVTDDTAAIQDMFDDAGDECMIVFTADKYLISNQIVIRNNNAIIRGRLGNSEASPQIRGDLKGLAFFRVLGSGVSFSNLLLWNSGTRDNTIALEFDADNSVKNGNVDAIMNGGGFYNFNNAITIKGRNLRLFDMIFSTCADCIILNQTDIATDLRGYDFVNNRIHSSNTFVRNNITNLRTPKNMFIRSNFMDYGATLFVGYGGGVVIQDNFLDAKGVGGTPITIMGDVLNSDNCINVIKNNVIYGNTNVTNGISLEDAVKCIVKENDITDCTYNGIAAAAGCYAIIEGNTLSNCGQNQGSYPIVAGAAATGYIVNNVVYNTTKGIGGAAGMTVSNNYLPS